jgi:hypothetical protein
MKRIGPILLGVLMIIFGLLVLFSPKVYLYGEPVDFSARKLPLTIILIGVGSLFVWSEIRKRKK